jgi:antitoxin HicB
VGRPADRYARLPYPVEVVPTGDGYLARVRDLPGCTARAETPEELWPAVERAKREWIEDALRRGEPVPEPGGGSRGSGGGEGRGGYSGRILVRVPKSLHAELIARAAQEGVSLNQFILAALARSLGPAAVQGEHVPPGGAGGRRRRGRGAPGPGQGPLAERD